jgi:hypothetical protein
MDVQALLDELVTDIHDSASTDYDTHVHAMTRVQDKLTRYYLHTTRDGVVHEGLAWLDLDVMGYDFDAVESLLVALRTITEAYDEIVKSKLWPLLVPDSKQWAGWKERLTLYFGLLAARRVTNDTAGLFTDVTAPLIQGEYPEGIEYPGLVVLDDIDKVPDFGTPLRQWWVTAILNHITTSFDQWLAEYETPLRLYVDELRAAAGKVADKILATGGSIIAIVGIGLGIGLILSADNKKK